MLTAAHVEEIRRRYFMLPRVRPDARPRPGTVTALGNEYGISDKMVSLLIRTKSTAPCACGCGERPIVGTFLRGHNRLGWRRPRLQTVKGYRFVGRKQLHRLRAERALGKPLPLGAEVHHADGTLSDDAPLVICQDRAYHALLHARMRVVRAGGNPNTERVCGTCKVVKSLVSFTPRAAECRGCRNLKAHAKRGGMRSKFGPKGPRKAQ